MPKFKADKAITDLEWDFNPHLNASGTIPEPSDAALVRYQQRMAEHARKYLPDVDPNNLREVVEANANVTGDEMMEAIEGQAQITGELCQDRPSAEQLLELPPRVRAAFYGWLQGTISPEA